jgi:hypothetical protein
MTRLFTDGAESGDVLRWTTSSNLSVTNSTKRTGSYSYSLTNGWAIKILPSTYTEFYGRFAFRSSYVGHALYWLNDANVAGSFRVKTYGSAAAIEMYDGTTLRATSSAFVMASNEWHVFEVHVKIAGVGVGRFEVEFDGTLVLDWTGATNNQASIDRFKIYSWDGATSLFDDIAFNDTAGAVDNSWCGDGGVLAALVPITGAAEYADLIASAGNAWDCVNEIPANSTDYVYESTVNKKSTYLLSDVAGLPSGASIARVWVELDALETAADGDKIATLLRSATTDDQGADQALTIAYARYLSAEYLVDPADSAVWSEAKINALQAGCIIR